MDGQNASNPHSQIKNANQPNTYQIRINGHLGSRWAEWFDGLTIILEEDGTTLLTGPVVDQAALHGILRKIRDLGLSLLSVNSDRTAPEESSEVNKGSDKASNP